MLADSMWQKWYIINTHLILSVLLFMTMLSLEKAMVLHKNNTFIINQGILVFPFKAQTIILYPNIWVSAKCYWKLAMLRFGISF